MPYTHRYFIYGPAALLFALVIGYSLYWRAQAAQFSAALDSANQHEILPGLKFAFAEKDISGFPFRLDAVLSGVTLAQGGKDGESAWRTEKMAIHALAYGGGQYLLEAAGLQSIALPSAGVPAQVYYVTPGTARASAIVTGGKLARFDFDMAFAKGEDATAGAGSQRDFQANRLQFHARRERDVIDIELQLDGAKLGGGYKSKLGNDITSAQLNATLSHAVVFDGVLSGHDGIANAMQAWRALHGTIDVQALEVTSDLVKSETLRGALTLDQNGALSGELRSNGSLAATLP